MRDEGLRHERHDFLTNALEVYVKLSKHLFRSTDCFRTENVRHVQVCMYAIDSQKYLESCPLLNHEHIDWIPARYACSAPVFFVQSAKVLVQVEREEITPYTAFVC